MKNISPWAQRAKDHWKRHRPGMYADLEASGQLDDRAEKAAEQTREEYHAGITNGMDPQASWESVRENHMFLPDEEDSLQEPTSCPSEFSDESDSAPLTRNLGQLIRLTRKRLSELKSSGTPHSTVEAAISPIPISWKNAALDKAREDQARDDIRPEPIDTPPFQKLVNRYTSLLLKHAREKVRRSIN